MANESTAAAAGGGKAERVNRYKTLFTGIAIKHSSDSTTVYGEDGGRKSKKLADVMLTLRDGCGVVTGKIQAVQQPGQRQAHADFSFTASMRGGQALIADSDAAQADLDSFKSGIVARYLAERKARRAAVSDDVAASAVLDDLSL